MSISPLCPKLRSHGFGDRQTARVLYFIAETFPRLKCWKCSRSMKWSCSQAPVMQKRQIDMSVLNNGFTLTWILLTIYIFFCLFTSPFFPGLFPAPLFHTCASQAFPYSTFCTLDSFWACCSSKLWFYFNHSCPDHMALSTWSIAFGPLGPLC